MVRQVVSKILFTAIFVSLWAGCALAGQFTVEPIKVIFNNRIKTVALKVTNRDNAKLTMQISAVTWSQDKYGTDVYGKTKHFLFFPRLATLAPNADRLVRIAYRGPPVKDREFPYRLFVEELPIGEVGGATAMRLVIKFSVPIFVEPARKVESWKIEQVSTVKDNAVVKINNTGNSHFIAQQITATGYDKPGGRELFKKSYLGWYVLPGMTLPFPTYMDRETCLKVRTIKMEVKVGETTKEMVGQVKPDPADCPTKAKDEERKKAAAVRKKAADARKKVLAGRKLGQPPSSQTQPAKKQ